MSAKQLVWMAVQFEQWLNYGALRLQNQLHNGGKMWRMLDQRKNMSQHVRLSRK
jgi:hypothetical protein